MMKNLIESFTNHLSTALQIGNKASFSPPKNNIQNVLIGGLGGSGIGGTIISQLISNQCKVPITVNKDYHIPAYVNSNTLVICCSYSGNTEETISMYEAAKSKGAEISIITSGGKFAELAKENNLNCIIIPGGLPPRAAFGLSFPQLLFTFHKYNLIDGRFISDLENTILTLNTLESDIQTEAKSIAEKLLNKTPIIYSESSKEGVSIRFRQQINENAKMLCWHHAIPELNHNELVGWRTVNQDFALVLFRSSEDFYRNQKRMEYSKNLINKYTETIIEIYAKGEQPLEEALYLIHLGDWVSLFLAELKGIDPVEVDVISGLKEMLENLD